MRKVVLVIFSMDVYKPGAHPASLSPNLQVHKVQLGPAACRGQRETNVRAVNGVMSLVGD